MPYLGNVQAMCDKMGIPNPIREKDLRIAAICFKTDQGWIRIEGTRNNRAGRLFFQYYFGDNNRIIEAEDEVNDQVLEFAARHFAENWKDAEKAGRPMLRALKKASHFKIFWKTYDSGEDLLNDE